MLALPSDELGVHPSLSAELSGGDLLDRGVQDCRHDRLASKRDG